MKTLYVPLDEVILLLHTNFPLLEQERTLRNALKDIEYLPTIDPIEEIDKMIEELKNTAIAEYMGNPQYIAIPAKIEVLEKLKSRLSPKL